MDLVEASGSKMATVLLTASEELGLVLLCYDLLIAISNCYLFIFKLLYFHFSHLIKQTA